MTTDNSSETATDGTVHIDISPRQRDRFDRIRNECKNIHVPAPSDELMFKSLMDEWEYDTIPVSEVERLIDDVESEILAEDMHGASREMVAEGTCQRLRDRIRALHEGADK